MPDQGIRFAQLRGNLPPLVAGDRVQWSWAEDGQPVIEALCERESLLLKRNRYGKDKLVVSNVDQALIVIAPEPEPYFELIDRYLIALWHAGIGTMLIINKSDLSDSPHWAIVESMQTLYAEQLGIMSYRVSAQAPCQYEALAAAIAGQTVILLGQSGVGKSTITQHLAGVEVRTQVLSEASGFGKHTTSATTAYPLRSGAGYLIDSPGVRGFTPAIDSEAALLAGYPEIAAVMNDCRFRNCTHQSEPGCAVQAAKAAGEIAAIRLENYFHIRSKLDV